MRTLLTAAGLLLAVSAAKADSIKVKVGHMCCGACKAAATAGLKNVAWADSTSIDMDTVTVNAKDGQKVEIVSLLEALVKCGFPATEIQANGPVTLKMAHLCCGSCVADLRKKVADVRSMTLDKDSIKIDQSSQTMVLQPMVGQTLNIVPLLSQIQRTGFSASTCTMSVAATHAPRPAATKNTH